MNSLPQSPIVDVDLLVRLFANTTNSYKYLFFNALLKLSRGGTHSEATRCFDLEEVGVEMLAMAWYPHTFFKLSFGLQDQVARSLDRLVLPQTARYPGSSDFQQDLRQAIRTQSDSIGLSTLLRYVPYRLLRPFYRFETQGWKDSAVNDGIRRLAQAHFDSRRPLYRLIRIGESDVLELHPHWLAYIERNRNILDGWASWEWLRFLQGRNPNIPALAEKLAAPSRRSALATQRGYWGAVLEQAEVRCVYTGLRLGPDDYALDHFIPWSFVCHDQLWNLHPVAPHANSTKGNAVPDESYVEAFVGQQCRGLLASKGRLPRARWDKLTLPFLSDLRLSKSALEDPRAVFDAYSPVLGSLMSLARQSGFPDRWRYSTADHDHAPTPA